MNAFCHKLLTKLHITKHTTLVESCSEEFLPIVTPINKKDLQRPQQQLDNQCRQMLFKETSPPRAEPTSCERQPTLPQYKFESLQRYQQATTARNGNQHCDNSTDGKGHNTTSCNGGATVTTAAATSATTINPNRLSASKNLQEFDFTLYDLNGHGRVTKDDIAGLVRTIYERIGCKIDLPRGGERRIRVKLEIVVDDRPTLNANEQEVAHQEISRTRHRSPIRVAFDEEQLLYETIKQYQQQHPMTDLRSSQKCNHQSPGNAHARTAKKVLTSEALRVRHSVPLSTPCTFVRTGGASHHFKAQTPFYSAANISSMTATASTPLVTSHSVYTTVATQPFCVTTAVNCTDTASTAAVVEHSQVGCHIGGNVLSSTSPHSPHSHSNEQHHYASSKKQHHYRRRRQHHLGGERTELNNVAKSQEKPDRPPSHGGRLREKPFVLKSPYDEETIPVSKSRHHGHRHHHHHHHQQLIRHVHHHYHHVA
ncbi:protein naked cuticle homolog 2-like isoform X2 [Varroa jacobsoni]|uniref:protein naked cuticle homolog 2-like isoform X2 n=1 Tax=Varroa jacobsoni TaxID=62625 RepID=UPI000BF7617E|nr:protein naked cuticle homolog 2-like isoform X2 [Varroa jacobsoni]